MKFIYVFNQLLPVDFVSAFMFFILRALLDVYTAQSKINKRPGPDFSAKIFFEKNWLRYTASAVAAVGLLIALPEGLSWFMREVFSRDEFEWNTILSASVGYAPIEIFLFIKKKMRKKTNEISDEV